MTNLMLSQCCTKCGLSKAVQNFYVDRRHQRPRAVCIACCIASRSANSGKRTPERRAEYARQRGITSVTYVPRDERKRISMARKQSEISRKREAKDAAREIRSRPMHDAHIRAHQSACRTVRWREKYRSDPKFAAHQRLRTQLTKKVRLYPRLGDLLRAAVVRDGSSGIVAMACGFTISQFIERFDRMFADGMDWDAFRRGEIHIDHINP